jgi:peptide deformylase
MKIENYKLIGESLPIITYPHPVLSKKAAEVTEFNSNLEKLVKNMLYTMYNAPGIGLAAPQVGISQRIFVLDIDYDREVITNSSGKDEIRLSNFSPMVLINPIITGNSGSMTYEEGCLSVPGIYEEVKRYKNIHVKYQNLLGDFLEFEAQDLLSVCMQHENDHLNGVVFIERLSNLKKNFYKNKILKEKNK